MSTSPLIQLGADDLVTALDGFEPVDVVAAELVAREAGGAAQSDGHIRLTRWLGRTTPPGPSDSEWMALEDPHTGPLCVLPTEGLMAGRTAALAGLAARTLLAAGPVTAAILGASPAVRSHLVVTRHLRRVGRIMVWPSQPWHGSPIESSLLDQLDLSGVRFVVAAAVEEAVVAANLVVAVDATPECLEIGQLARGTVVVNAAGQGWSQSLIGSVDELYVDDAALVGPEPGRLAGRKVDADLAQVLTGARPGRTDADHVVLVELLGSDVLDVQLAQSVHRVAVERALGTRLPG